MTNVIAMTISILRCKFLMGFEEWRQSVLFTFYKSHTGYSVEKWFSKKKRRSGILKAYSIEFDISDCDSEEVDH